MISFHHSTLLFFSTCIALSPSSILAPYCFISPSLPHQLIWHNAPSSEQTVLITGGACRIGFPKSICIVTWKLFHSRKWKSRRVMVLTVSLFVLQLKKWVELTSSWTMTDMPIEQMMATNTMGHFWTIDMFLPGMLRQNAGQKYFNNHPLQHPCQHGEHQ